MPDPSSVIPGIASKVFTDLFSKLAASVISVVSKPVYNALTKAGSSFEAHLQATFERCTKIKTLLNRDEPVSLLDQYVNIKFKHDEKNFDDYELIREIPNRKRTIITGSGGGGKTIFMKYLWISLFENPRGKIPVFVELRRLNDVTSDRLDLYVYHSIIDTQSTLSQSAFEQGIRDGSFVLILDGFDEILAEKRKSLEKQILDWAHNNPALTIIVSGRWDDRFAAWQAFSTFHVLPFDKKQTVDLVQKLRYDRVIKKKFVDRLQKDLYLKHRSFLSSPLLATMMLLTFDQFADIPEKIHLFYEQAFDTLFARHDATKEAFKRIMYSDFSIDIFKVHLSYFCLASYYDEKFEFTQTEVINYITKSLRIDETKASPQHFLQDLVESVCILQKDGLNFVFTHRSFQEFFAAYCLARVSHKHIFQILMKFARRSTDNVLKMLYDMDRDLVEGSFVVPALTELVDRIKAIQPDQFLVGYLPILGAELRIYFDKDSVRITEERTEDLGYFVSVLEELYPQVFDFSERKMSAFRNTDATVIRKNISVGAKAKAPEVVSVEVDEKNRMVWRTRGRPAEGAEWLSETGYARFCREEADGLVALLGMVEKHRGHKTQAIDDLLGLK